jgi:hypothetical protein
VSLVHSCNVSTLAAAAASSSSSSGSLPHKCVSPPLSSHHQFANLLVANCVDSSVKIWFGLLSICEKNPKKFGVRLNFFVAFFGSWFLELERRVLFCFCSCCCFLELPALLRGEGVF